MFRAFFRRLPLLASLVLLLAVSVGGLHVKSAHASCGASVTKAYTANASNSPQTVFQYGSSIRYVADVYNSCSSSLTITLGFFATWGNVTGTFLSQIFNQSHTFSIPSGTTGWYVGQTIYASTTFPGTHTYQARLYNSSGQPYSQANATFHVSGTRIIVNSSGYPATSYFYSQFSGTQYNAASQNCGPATVAMMLAFLKKNPLGLTGGPLINEVRTTIGYKFGNWSGPTTGPQLYFALMNYWYNGTYHPTGVNGQSIGKENPQPFSQENWIVGSMTANRPIAILVNACSATCPAGSVYNVPSPNIGRNYAGHWLEVIGTYDDGTYTYFVIHDPDNSSTGTNGHEPVYGWVAASSWPATTIGNSFHYVNSYIESDNYIDISGQ
jgi:hypothetical protein